MTEYKCIVCNYSTMNNSNFNKHILTNKHIEKINSCFRCDRCKYMTDIKVNYSKHLETKKHLKKSNENNIYPEQIKELLLQVKEEVKEVNKEVNKEKDEAKKTIDLLMKKIDILEKKNDQNTNKLKETNDINTQKIVTEARTIKKSILTLLNTHFKDTPSIEYIKQEAFFKELEKEYKMEINDGKALSIRTTNT